MAIAGSANKVLMDSNECYYNNYTANRDSKKIGDALECYSWLRASGSYWVQDNYCMAFIRGDESLFGYSYTSGSNNGGTNIGGTTRAVVVCGENL